MSVVTALGTLIGKITLAVGFVGIGLLGLALMAMAVGLSGNGVWRLIIFVMGILAVLIAIGTGITAKNRPKNHTV